jgi:hypothetical protein
VAVACKLNCKPHVNIWRVVKAGTRRTCYSRYVVQGFIGGVSDYESLFSHFGSLEGWGTTK